MCFLKLSFDLSHDIAEADLVCYKVLIGGFGDDGKEYRSPYYFYPYRLGEISEIGLNKADVIELDRREVLNDGVFHSYHSYAKAYHLYSEVRRRWAIDGKLRDVCLVKCIIPRGSVVWENYTEYASDKIKLVEIVL